MANNGTLNGWKWPFESPERFVIRGIATPGAAGITSVFDYTDGRAKPEPESPRWSLHDQNRSEDVRPDR